MTFGERLAELRKKQGLSQSELAKKLNISKSTLAMYETDKRQPNFETQTKIADFFEVSIDYLLGRSIDHIYPKYNLIKVVDSEINESKGTSYSTPSIIIELSKFIKEHGIEQLGFFDVAKWKDLSQEDIEEITRHFEWIAHKAKERTENNDHEE